MSGEEIHSTPSRYLITAAAGGIGSALARLLVGAGHDVALVDVSRRRLEKLEAELAAFPGTPTVMAVKADLTDPDEVERAVTAVDEGLGGIDGLANVVGGVVGDLESFYDKDIELLTPDEWEQTLRINLFPTYLTTRAVTRRMRRGGGGAVVNVASMAHLGRIPEMGNVAYDAAKAAVVALTRSLSRQLGPDGIRVNAVAPGLTLSAGLERIVSPRLVDVHRSATPLGRNGTPEDVAEVMAFLLGPRSRHVSGEVVHVAGGRA